MTSLFPLCIVHHGTARVVKQFGKIARTLEPGVHWVTPFLDSYVSVNWRFSGAGSRVHGYDIPVNKLSFDPEGLSCTTADQLDAKIDLLVEFCITDVAKAVTQTSNLFASIESIVLAAIYETSRSVKLAELSPRVIEAAVNQAIAKTAVEYGFQVTRVYVEQIAGPASIAKATEAVETQRRQKVAELDKLQQESEIKLSQQRLKMMLTEASGVEEQLIATNYAKRVALAARAEIEISQLKLAHELECQQKRRAAETDAYRAQQAAETEAYRVRQAAEADAYRQRLADLASATMADEVKVALLRSEALQALAKDPSTKLILSAQESLGDQHLHLQGPNLLK